MCAAEAAAAAAPIATLTNSLTLTDDLGLVDMSRSHRFHEYHYDTTFTSVSEINSRRYDIFALITYLHLCKAEREGDTRTERISYCTAITKKCVFFM